MATNPYLSVHTYGYAPSITLYENMIIENIQISGQDFYYIPRELSPSLDQIFGEDVLSSFSKYAIIEAGIESVSGWGGSQELVSKFGFEVRNTTTLIMSRKRFGEVCTPIVPDNRPEVLRTRPCEGDLFYLPFSNSLMEIKFVDDENPVFYQLSKKYTWSIRCELVQLNNESFTTGIPEIDVFGINLNRLNSSITLEDGANLVYENGGVILDESYTVGEPYTEQVNFGDNDVIKKEFMDILNFNAQNPFSESF